MYTDIGKKIKSWAKVVCIAEAIAAVIGALIMMFSAEDGIMMAIGLFLLVGGPVVAWVSSWLLYGFGEIIDKLTEIEENTRPVPDYEDEETDDAYTAEQFSDLEKLTAAQKAERAADKSRQAKIDRITRLRDSGLISEEQYRQAVNNPNVLDKF